MDVPTPGVWLHLESVRRGDELLICATGELDLASAPALEAAVLSALGDDAPALVTIDAAELAFVDAAGLGALVRCWQRLGEDGCRLRLRKARRYVHEILVLTDVARLLEVPETGPLALDTLPAPTAEPPTA